MPSDARIMSLQRHHIGRLTGELSKKDAEIARLRAALEFYADEVNWCPQGMAWSTYTGTESLASNVQDDLGQRARRALDGKEADGE